MQQFRTILVPVDFSVNTEVAVFKAIELADNEHAVIHLLHVCRDYPGPAGKRRNYKAIEAEIMLNEWKQNIEEHLPGSQVFLHLQYGLSVQNKIRKMAVEYQPDLVIVGKRSKHFWLPVLNRVTPSVIAKKTGIAVLTVKPGSLHNKIKNVVVPVSDDMPAAKLEALTVLCKKSHIKIYLVMFASETYVPVKFSAAALLRVYQWLKTSLHCQVEYTVLQGHNKAKAILRFAEKNNADVLLLNTESETRINWPGAHISDLLSPTSKVQVLTV